MVSFHDMYQQYAGDVFRFSLWLIGNRSEAEDITSDTFVRAWTSKAEIRAETVKAYLLTIAKNLCVEFRRKAARTAEPSHDLVDPRPLQDRSTEHRDDLLRVIDRIADLPETDRQCFLLRVGGELPYSEIARTLQLSETAVKVKVHRVRLKLAQTHSGVSK